MRKRWTAAGMLVVEQQFRRIIGYRHLATLVIAVERHALHRQRRLRPPRERRAGYRLTVTHTGSPPLRDGSESATVARGSGSSTSPKSVHARAAARSRRPPSIAGDDAGIPNRTRRSTPFITHTPTQQRAACTTTKRFHTTDAQTAPDRRWPFARRHGRHPPPSSGWTPTPEQGSLPKGRGGVAPAPSVPLNVGRLRSQQARARSKRHAERDIGLPTPSPA
jgi:hypothetical protein